MRRRSFLSAGAGATIAVTAGCLGGIAGGREGRGLTLQSVEAAGSPGGPISLRPPGKVVLLDFFATWCPPCRPQMSNLRTVRERFDPAAFHMVSITTESSREAIRDFWRQYNGIWPVAQDPNLEATRKYDVKGVPTLVVLTPDGETVFRHRGLAGERRLSETIRSALDRSDP